MTISRETVAQLADAAVLIDGIKESFGEHSDRLLQAVNIIHAVAKCTDDAHNFNIYEKDCDS